MNELFEVPEALRGTTLIDERGYRSLYEHSVANPEEFWAEQCHREILIRAPWKKVLEYDYHAARIAWFSGAKVNVCENCVDRHLATRADQRAIVWEGNEPGETRTLTYRELSQAVNRLANALTKLGVKKGDRVSIYMPMVPEAAVAMLACARIGAIHSVVFAGFSAEALRGRIENSQCSIVITADEGVRGAKRIPLKATVDAAIDGLKYVRNVLVFKRTGSPISMDAKRDIWWHDALSAESEECRAVEMDAEDPLFILYTSGSTGKPKGVLHTQLGYLLYVALTHRYVFDYRDGDLYFCAADVGWITGHSYVVYGPLANGASTLMFESIPTYPNAGRYWDVIQRHGVRTFYTAPTAIRAVAKEGPELPERYDLSSLRVIGSVGEPINRDAWLWYYRKVGREKCALVDTWWQTETGGIMITPLPGVSRLKPSSATLPFFGVRPCLVDDQGQLIQDNGVRGNLCLDFPWPGQARTVYGDHERFRQTYFSAFPGKYFTGDAAERDQNGYYIISGRVDDVLNVAGHRLGTAEVESAIVSSGIVAEAAVVGIPHDVKGLGICAFCILREGERGGKAAVERVHAAVRKSIGGIAVPDKVYFVAALPKTRSGKIMRRILRKITEGETENFGDISSLADPEAVRAIVADVVREVGDQIDPGVEDN